MAAEKVTKTDFNVWYETSELAKSLKAGVCAKWVKGHQDKHIKGVYAGIGLMSLEAKFNILVDRRAEKRQLVSTVTFHTIPFQSERAMFTMDDSIVTTHIAKHITHAKTTPAMKSYITEKK